MTSVGTRVFVVTNTCELFVISPAKGEATFFAQLSQRYCMSYTDNWSAFGIQSDLVLFSNGYYHFMCFLESVLAHGRRKLIELSLNHDGGPFGTIKEPPIIIGSRLFICRSGIAIVDLNHPFRATKYVTASLQCA